LARNVFNFSMTFASRRVAEKQKLYETRTWSETCAFFNDAHPFDVAGKGWNQAWAAQRQQDRIWKYISLLHDLYRRKKIGVAKLQSLLPQAAIQNSAILDYILGIQGTNRASIRLLQNNPNLVASFAGMTWTDEMCPSDSRAERELREHIGLYARNDIQDMADAFWRESDHSIGSYNAMIPSFGEPSRVRTREALCKTVRVRVRDSDRDIPVQETILGHIRTTYPQAYANLCEQLRLVAANWNHTHPTDLVDINPVITWLNSDFEGDPDPYTSLMSRMNASGFQDPDQNVADEKRRLVLFEVEELINSIAYSVLRTVADSAGAYETFENHAYLHNGANSQTQAERFAQDHIRVVFKYEALGNQFAAALGSLLGVTALEDQHICVRALLEQNPAARAQILLPLSSRATNPISVTDLAMAWDRLHTWANAYEMNRENEIPPNFMCPGATAPFNFQAAFTDPGANGSFLRYSIDVVNFAEQQAAAGRPVVVFFTLGDNRVIRANKTEQNVMALPYLLREAETLSLDSGMAVSQAFLNEWALIHHQFVQDPSLGFITTAQDRYNADYTLNTFWGGGIGETVFTYLGQRELQPGVGQSGNLSRGSIASWDALNILGSTGEQVAEDTFWLQRAEEYGFTVRHLEIAGIEQFGITEHQQTTNLRGRYHTSATKMQKDMTNYRRSDNVLSTQKVKEDFSLSHFAFKAMAFFGIVSTFITNVLFPRYSIFPALDIQYSGYILPAVVWLVAVLVAYLGGWKGARTINRAMIWVVIGAIGIFYLAHIGVLPPTLPSKTFFGVDVVWGSIPFILLGWEFALDKLIPAYIHLTEHYGFGRGSLMLLWRFPTMYRVYVHLLVESVLGSFYRGFRGLAVFVRASRMVQVIRFSEEDIYDRNISMTKVGVVMSIMTVMAMTMNFYGSGFLALLFTFLFAGPLLTTPNLMNSHRSSNTRRALAYYWTVIHFWRALGDLIVAAPAFFVRGHRRTEEPQMEFRIGLILRAIVGLGVVSEVARELIWLFTGNGSVVFEGTPLLLLGGQALLATLLISVWFLSLALLSVIFAGLMKLLNPRERVINASFFSSLRRDQDPNLRQIVPRRDAPPLRLRLAYGFAVIALLLLPQFPLFGLKDEMAMGQRAPAYVKNPGIPSTDSIGSVRSVQVNAQGFTADGAPIDGAQYGAVIQPSHGPIFADYVRGRQLDVLNAQMSTTAELNAIDPQLVIPGGKYQYGQADEMISQADLKAGILTVAPIRPRQAEYDLTSQVGQEAYQRDLTLANREIARFRLVLNDLHNKGMHVILSNELLEGINTPDYLAKIKYIVEEMADLYGTDPAVVAFKFWNEPNLHFIGRSESDKPYTIQDFQEIDDFMRRAVVPTMQAFQARMQRRGASRPAFFSFGTANVSDWQAIETYLVPNGLNPCFNTYGGAEEIASQAAHIREINQRHPGSPIYMSLAEFGDLHPLSIGDQNIREEEKKKGRRLTPKEKKATTEQARADNFEAQLEAIDRNKDVIKNANAFEWASEPEAKGKEGDEGHMGIRGQRAVLQTFKTHIEQHEGTTSLNSSTPEGIGAYRRAFAAEMDTPAPQTPIQVIAMSIVARLPVLSVAPIAALPFLPEAWRLALELMLSSGITIAILVGIGFVLKDPIQQHLRSMQLAGRST